MGRCAYGAFVIQTPVLVGLALPLRPLPVPAVVKLAVLAPAAVLLSFALAAVLLTAPMVRRVL